MYDELSSENGKDIIISGRRAAGILEAVQKGSVNLPNLDPFQDLEHGTSSEINFGSSFPGEGHGDVNERYDSDINDEYINDEENEYDIDEDRNAFSAVAEM